MVSKKIFLIFLLIPALSLAQAQHLKSKENLFSTPQERCILPAAQYHHVNPFILRAILNLESSLKSNAVNTNSNGTVDLGMGQINSIHFAELDKWGVTPQKLMDACVSTYVAAWHLKRGITKHGNTWFGIAAYHSTTPKHNAKYQALVYKELVRIGAVDAAPKN
jgi:soluble lytic murein transglycosylase-like protein